MKWKNICIGEINMTLKQIERTREFLSCIDSLQGLTDTQKIVDEMRAFYGEEFNVSLQVRRYNTFNSYSSEYKSRDQKALKGFLEGYLAKQKHIDEICKILDLIEKGNVLQSDDERYAFLMGVYHSYYGKIAFDKIIELIATSPKEAIKLHGYQVTEDVTQGLISKLRLYANELCDDNQKDTNAGNIQGINFQPQINVETTNQIAFDMSVVFENARQRAEDFGLSDEQYKAVMEKITELETLIKGKESKGKRWQKVKECLKWIVEQGIQVAGILLPVIMQVIQ